MKRPRGGMERRGGEEKSTLRVSPPRLCLTKLQMETPGKKEIELIVIKSCITRRDRLLAPSGLEFSSPQPIQDSR